MMTNKTVKINATTRKSLIRAGVESWIIDSMNQNQDLVKNLNKSTFWGKIIQGGYYTQVKPTGLYGYYGEFYTWAELEIMETDDQILVEICEDAKQQDSSLV